MYSESVGGWVGAAVVELAENGEARVRYTTKTGQLREKLVSAVSSEFRRKIHQDARNDVSVGKKMQEHAQLTDEQKTRAKAALLRTPASRGVDSVRELVKWTYEVDLFHGLSYSERQALCMECDGELVDQHEALVGVGQSLTKVSKTPSWPRSWANFSLL